MYALLDGVAVNREHPDTFHIPSYEHKMFVIPGDHVKLMFESDGEVERMWVVITAGKLMKAKHDSDGCTWPCNHVLYTGTLANDPFMIEGLVYGDTVSFTADNIIDITQKNGS